MALAALVNACLHNHRQEPTTGGKRISSPYCTIFGFSAENRDTHPPRAVSFELG